MDQELVNIWAVKIAEVAVPDEVDLAPMIVQAFLRGGKARQDLFRQAQSDIVGGFGAPELQAIFPWILEGIVTVAPILYTMITSGAVEKFLEVIKSLLTIQDSLARKKKAETLPDDPYQSLKRVTATLSKDLAKVKMSQEQRELVTYHVIQELLKDPSSIKFVKEIAGDK